MKKLMIALSAVTLAMGVNATVIQGTTFNDGKTDGFTGLTDESQISNVPFVASSGENVTDYSEESKDKNLAIKTKLDAPAYYELDSAASMDGTFFDSMVKFTYCDEDATIPTGSNAKLMVWVKETEAEGATAGSTNLMITAGYFADTEGKIDTKNYNCGPISGYGITGADDWARLTIKSIPDITAAENGFPGFNVFVNAKRAKVIADKAIGVPGSYADSLTRVANEMKKGDYLFPSMIQDQAAELTGVGFAGQGAIDNIAFTTTTLMDKGGNEFTADPIPAIATVNGQGCGDIAAINNAISTAAEGAAVVLVYNVEDGDLTFDNGKANTLELGGFTLDGGITVSSGSLAINGTGTVSGNVANSGTDLVINDGTFDGTVNVGRGVVVHVNGGAFLASENVGLVAGAIFPKGKTLILDESDGYLKLGDKPPFSGGTGTEADPYQLAKEEDLIQLKDELATYNDKFFMLTADIDATQGLNPWPGIGTYEVNGGSAPAFKGKFNGNGFKITGLIMKDMSGGNADSKANNYRGFFNQLEGAVVSNLTVECNGFETCVSTEYGCAAIAGHAYCSTIEGCTSKGTISSGTHNVGGIVIRARGSTIKNCVNEANITGNYTKIAGICVLTQNETSGQKSVIEGCVNKGTITCAGKTGSTVATDAGRDGCAGILAYLGTADVTTIKDCSNEGAIVKGDFASADAGLGQIVGYHYVQLEKIDGTNTGLSDVPFVGKVQNTQDSDGLCFATVENSVATGVKKADLVKDGETTYKVMAPNAAVTLAKGQSIKLDTSLVACVPTTTETGYNVVPDGDAQPITYSVVAETYTITYTWTGVDAGDLGNIVNPNKATSYTVESETITFTAPSCEGYTFNNDLNPVSIAKGSTDNVTVTGSFTKNQVYPPEWPETSDEIKKKYATWKEGKILSEDDAVNQKAFLLNVDPQGTIPELKIESITVANDVATIVVSAGTADLEEVNGILYVDAANDLTDWTTTEVDLAKNAQFAEGKATFTVSAGKFMKAGVGFKAPEAPVTE